MKSKNIYDNIFEKKCAVCGHKYMADIYDQGECLNCGWYNGHMYEELPDDVVFSNLISLNKARELYKQGKPSKPSLEDFMEGFECYGEMEFWIKGINYCLFRWGEAGIQMAWSPEPDGIAYFKDKRDFINNAKIGDKFLKDIWELVENPKYM